MIIVGAGPAGSTLGYELARKGIKTLIVEKETFPRYKPCGGGIPYRTAVQVGFDLQPVFDDTITAATLSYRLNDGTTRSSPIPLAYTTNRADLDDYLLIKAREAGCEAREGQKVSGLIREAHGFEVVYQHGDYEGRIVVGADGANGIVRQSLKMAGEYRWNVSIEDEIEVGAGDLDRWRDRVHLDLGDIPYGYGWVFPKGDHLSVGVAGRQQDARAVLGYYRQFSAYLQKSSRRYSIMRHSGHRLPMRPAGTPLAVRDALLIGDAAGLTEPLSGEGIFYAVRSTQIAAKAIQDHLCDPSSGLCQYEQTIDAEVMPNLQRAKAFVRIFNHASRFFYYS